MTAKTSPAPAAADKKAATPTTRRTAAAKKAAPAKAAPAKKTAPVKKASEPKPEVDITRKTPYGTEYRVVRAATEKIDVGENKWATICLAHGNLIGSASLRLACLAGTKGATAEWCADCAKIRDGKDKAAPKAAAKPATASKTAPRSTTRRRQPKAASKDESTS